MSRTIVRVLALIVFVSVLSVQLASAAGARGEERREPTATAKLIRALPGVWTFLAHLWGQSGSSLDPFGSPIPNSGSSLDPFGGGPNG